MLPLLTVLRREIRAQTNGTYAHNVNRPSIELEPQPRLDPVITCTREPCREAKPVYNHIKSGAIRVGALCARCRCRSVSALRSDAVVAGRRSGKHA